MVLKHRFCPGHLNTDIFLKVYGGVKDERMDAKAKGDKLKDATLKLSINGAYGMFGNQYSWLFDHKVRLQICVNGQLMLAMLIEELMLEGIKLIDANTDGIYVYVHKSKKARFLEIVVAWEKTTKMDMEQTRFEKMWFLNSAEYFGTYMSKGKLAVKEKGMFQSAVQLGKGMEFQVISKSVKEHFLNGKSFDEYIKECDNILDFCSYKKLSKGAECWHNGYKIQRINRFYASKTGAYLYRKSVDQPLEEVVTINDVYSPIYGKNVKKSNLQHLLKESPVAILNQLDNKPIEERGINYGFYTSAARAIVHTIQGEKSLF